LVVSPLVALMRDQVEALTQRTAFNQLGCAYINSLQSIGEQRERLQQLREGMLRLVYVAPERFRSPEFVQTLSMVPIARFVVDEAHCISEWGHDFRPDYLTLRGVVESLGRPPLMALTATATARVQKSIVDNLGMREPDTFIGGFNRPNLHFAAHRCKSETERAERLERALPKLAAMGGSGLIYVATRKQCEQVASLAARALAPASKKAAPYHAGMDAATRNVLQSEWLSGAVHTLVATNAFGMGIDKSDVRFVVHYVYPDSLESYYQEAGRAGRDGRKSRCVILHCFADRRTREWFIDNDALTVDDVRSAHRELCGRPAGEVEGVLRVPRVWWSQALQWNETKTRLALGELERAGLVQRLGESADDAFLRVTRRDFPREALQRIAIDLARQREERYRRLDEITAYCKTTTCRRRAVLEYFGDPEPPDANGSCCDNCERPASAASVAPLHHATPSRVPMPAQVQSGDIHSLLQGLDALRPRVGKARLIRLLRGSASRDVEKFQRDGSPLYGVLRHRSQAQVNDFLETLIERGLLHQADEDEYFVCTVTAAGRAAWQEKQRLDIALPGAPRPGVPRRRDATPGAAHPTAAPHELMMKVDEGLFETLRMWRRGQALSENLPPYCIFSDRTMQELARLKPTDESELRTITGIGEAKLEKYGAAVLEVLRSANTAQSTPVQDSTASAPEMHANHSIAAPAALTETAAETYLLLQSGFDVEEIAEGRGLKSATIWAHLEQIIDAGMLDETDVEALIPHILCERIVAALAELPVGVAYKEVWEKLDGEIDYGPIRCVALLRRDTD
ncbi:MAG TPA: RecQ family ATP-dependent DNA helicase, partial [Abditibacteriaceae bacterium]|nr:RecQ family ATP-dependent DNA helicase [Abditibacteriaceae bacterium]